MRYLFRKEFFGGVLFDRENHEYLFCDNAVASSLHRCSVESLIQNVHPEFVHKTNGLFNNDGSTNFRILDTQPQEGILSSPLQIYYDFTTYCNLSCPHCYTSSGLKQNNELTYSEIRDWAVELSRNGVFKISLGGGEPLLHPQGKKIIRTFVEQDIALSLSTNGLLFSDNKLISFLNELKLRTVNISIEGGTRKSYESIRGKGNWGLFQKSVKRFAKLYKGRFALRVTIVKQTVNEVREILKIGRELGAYCVKFKFLQLGGRSKNNMYLFPTPLDNFRVVHDALSFSKELGVKVAVPNIFSNGRTETSINRYYPLTADGKLPFRHSFGCGGGQIGAYVHPDGTYSACVSMGKEYDAYNVRTHSLRDAWANGPGFIKMRNILTNQQCFSCQHLLKCNGGCRARALSVYDDPGAIDPYCPHVESSLKPLALIPELAI
ncbi:MAG: hypothetical protein COA36_17605 [Desulfotalea sp.]|nr:MAG: hypothetical protein COA36_17605 [Desulfotalea sp.]